MKQLKLTPDQEELLRAQVIDTARPGPILRDFQTVLNYVGTEGVKAGGKYNMLPLDSIAVLDPQLSRPLQLQLTMKRPQLRSHPYLQGLHLLLRASGISQVSGTGEKARLALDPVVLQRWNQLNLTEQYFTLLEAWLLVGTPEMVGEQGRSWGDGFLRDCVQTWRETPAKGTRFNLKKPQDVYFLGIGREFYHLALMDLFGLMEVAHPPQGTTPWCPAGLKHLPFGDAVFTLLAKDLFDSVGLLDEEDEDEEEDEADEEEGEDEELHFGCWQPLFQPYFPEYRSALIVPGAESRKGVFVFRVSLGKVWRLIALESSATLDDLVGWILKSVGFDNDHLYQFKYRDRFGATAAVHHPAMDEGPWTDEVSLGDLPLKLGDSMLLWYDFGDDWEFDVKLERIEPPSARIKAPRILEKHGKAPKQYPRWE